MKKGWRIIIVLVSVVLITGVGAAVYLNYFTSWDKSDYWDVYVNKEESVVEFDPSPLDFTNKYEEAVELLGDIELTDYIVVVDVSEQKEYIFKKGGEFVAQYKISTGADSVPVLKEDCDDCEDPYEYDSRSMTESVWRVEAKYDGPFSAFYGPRIMMLSKRTGDYWVSTDVALHGTSEPDRLGTPWSLGCIYHNNDDILELYDLLEVGDLVVAII